MDLSIKSDNKNKMPRVNASLTKKVALKDISKECKTGFFTKNYLSIENLVMNYCKCKEVIININNLNI